MFDSGTWNARLSPEMLNYEFDTKNLVSLVVSGGVGVWYLLKKVGVAPLASAAAVFGDG